MSPSQTTGSPIWARERDGEMCGDVLVGARAALRGLTATARGSRTTAKRQLRPSSFDASCDRKRKAGHADPACSLGARNRRSRESCRRATRLDNSPNVRGQLSPPQPTHTALGSVLRRAVPASQVAPPRPPPLTSRTYAKQATGRGRGVRCASARTSDGVAQRGGRGGVTRAPRGTDGPDVPGRRARSLAARAGVAAAAAVHRACALLCTGLSTTTMKAT
jgi:hypothetical protein